MRLKIRRDGESYKVLKFWRHLNKSYINYFFPELLPLDQNDTRTAWLGLCDGTIPVNDLLIWPASYKPTSPCSLFFYFELGWWSLQVCRSFTREFSVPLLGISSFHQSFFSFLNFATLVVFSTCSSVSRKVNAAFDCDLNQREMAELWR